MKALQWLLLVFVVCAIAYGIYYVVKTGKNTQRISPSAPEAANTKPAPPAGQAGALLTISLYGGFHIGDEVKDLTAHLESQGIEFTSEPRAHQISFRVTQNVLGLPPPLPLKVTVISVSGNIEEMAVSATGRPQSDGFRLFERWAASLQQTCGEPSNKNDSESGKGASWTSGGNTLSLDASKDENGGTYTVQIDLSSSSLP